MWSDALHDALWMRVVTGLLACALNAPVRSTALTSTDWNPGTNLGRLPNPQDHRRARTSPNWCSWCTNIPERSEAVAGWGRYPRAGSSELGVPVRAARRRSMCV
jgi:hypothetical protein